MVFEHCKSLAVFYLVRLANADLYYDRVKDYYKNALKWFERVAGIGEGGRELAPDLPTKKDAGGTVITKIRAGSRPKFNHSW